MSTPSWSCTANRSLMAPRREVEDLLHPERVVGRLGPGQQPGLLGQERVDPVAGDDHRGVELGPVTVGAHADHPAGAVADQPGGHRGGHQPGPGRRWPCRPARRRSGTAAWSCRCRGPSPRRRCGSRRTATGSRSSSWWSGAPPTARPAPPPTSSARCRRAPGRRRPRRRRSWRPGRARARPGRPTARPGPGPGRPTTRPVRRPTTTASNVEDLRHGRSSGCRTRRRRRPRRRASSTSSARASVTRPRSAMAVIGHDGSVLTLTTWRGAPRPPVCCAAPETAEGHVEVGVDGHPGGADLALVAGPPGVGGHPGGPGRPAEGGGHGDEQVEDAGGARRSSSPATRPAPPATTRVASARSMVCEVRARAGRPVRRRRRRPVAGDRGRAPRARHRTASGGAPPWPAGRPPTARVTTAGPRTSTGTSTRSSHPADRARTPGPVTVRRPRRPAARATSGRPVAAASRGARSRPSGEAGSTTRVSSATTGARAAARAPGSEPGAGVGPAGVR